MNTQTITSKKSKRSSENVTNNSGSFIWFLGFIGAFVYYLQEASGFGEGVLGFFKALVWPALLVYKLLS